MDPDYERDPDCYWGDEYDVFDDDGNYIGEELPTDDASSDSEGGDLPEGEGDPPAGEENSMRWANMDLGPEW